MTCNVFFNFPEGDLNPQSPTFLAKSDFGNTPVDLPHEEVSSHRGNAKSRQHCCREPRRNVAANRDRFSPLGRPRYRALESSRIAEFENRRSGSPVGSERKTGLP